MALAAKTLFDTFVGETLLWRGSFVLNGATPVTVSNLPLQANATIEISLAKVGGTVGAQPTIETITYSTAGSPGPQGSTWAQRQLHRPGYVERYLDL
jgi:hypothetical protein